MNSSQIRHIQVEWIGKSIPHSIIPDFLDRQRADLIARDLKDTVNSRLPTGAFVHYQNPWEHQKYTLNDLDQMSTPVRGLINEFQSEGFIKDLESATGLRGLVADPGLWGGGVHCTLQGGHLGIHQDFPVLPTSYGRKRELRRVLNLILFLNPYAGPANAAQLGGALEFWSADMRSAAHVIPPVFNTAALFWTPGTNHGQPEPWSAPRSEPRLSIAIYYYQEIPAGSIEHRSTLYLLRPGDSETPEEFWERSKRASADRYRQK